MKAKGPLMIAKTMTKKEGSLNSNTKPPAQIFKTIVTICIIWHSSCCTAIISPAATLRGLDYAPAAESTPKWTKSYI
jgi:hypothetical protein